MLSQEEAKSWFEVETLLKATLVMPSLGGWFNSNSSFIGMPIPLNMRNPSDKCMVVGIK